MLSTYWNGRGHFLSPGRAFFSVSCRAGLLSRNMHSLKFLLVWECLYFQQMVLLDLKVSVNCFCFQQFENTIPLPSVVQVFRKEVSLTYYFCSCTWWTRFLCPFQDLFGFQGFGYNVSKCGFSVFIILKVRLNSLDLQINIFHQFWAIILLLFPRFLSSPFLWDYYYTSVDMFGIPHRALDSNMFF